LDELRPELEERTRELTVARDSLKDVLNKQKERKSQHKSLQK
jgi:hypothetical protein